MRATVLGVLLGVLAASCGATTSPEPPQAAGSRSAPRIAEASVGQPSPFVDPGRIVEGGPPPDGIPPIDDPKFLPTSKVEFLSSREPVIAIALRGDARAYPVQILMWHEIVNDTVAGVPVTVTYCPLCNTAIAFRRPTVDGRLLDFGTSGKLYNSNLLMYDRQTESLWAQALGQAVVGPLTGTTLQMILVQMVSWEDWARRNPHGKVLSRNTGHARAYGENPYDGYDARGPFLFDGPVDPRLPATARVVGVWVGSDIVAFPYEFVTSNRVGDWAVAEATVGGRDLVVFWKAGTVSALDAARIADSRDVGATGVFDRSLAGRTLSFHPSEDGVVDEQTGTTWDIFGRAVAGPLADRSLDRVISIESFWFDWAAFHPDTRIYGR